MLEINNMEGWIYEPLEEGFIKEKNHFFAACLYLVIGLHVANACNVRCRGAVKRN